MKALKLLTIIGTIAAATGCGKSGKTITGTYVLSFRNEYSIATDTIIITTYNASSGSYEVERRDGFNRLHDGKTLPEEYRQEKWVATYDKNKQVLQETAYGRQVYIDANSHTLNYNGVYKKIK